MRRLLALGSVVLLGSLPLATAADTPTFTSRGDMVNVTLAVRDGKGQLVTDLSPDDFVVREDGRPQHTLVFARAFDPGQDETLTLDLGLLLDTSGSMMEALKLTQEAATRFLENVPRARDLLLVFFDSDIQVSRFDSENQQGIFDRIEGAKANGTTALYDAIAIYLGRVRNNPGRKVLVVFTDGEDSVSRLGRGEVLDLARASGVTVYPVAMQAGMVKDGERAQPAMAFLRMLAEVTGGQVFQPSTSKDLTGIYTKILDELKAQYVLGFTSDNPRQDGKFRKIKVEVKRPGVKVTHRSGYHAPLPPADSGQ